jgi:hypothetical protein
MTFNVYIGTEDDQFIPQKVLEYSIKKNTKTPVSIHAIKQNFSRVGGTNFGFVRFLVPSLNEFQGVAVYLDADQLVLTDIADLFAALDQNHSVALVKTPEGFFGDKPVGQHNQTSVMVLDCAKLRGWDPDVIFQNVVPNRTHCVAGQIHYRDFMMLAWFDQDKIQALDPSWNHFNIIREDSKITHFSHVRSQPWKNPSHPLAKWWGRWLAEAIGEGAISRRELIREIWRGAVHRKFLGCLI